MNGRDGDLVILRAGPLEAAVSRTGAELRRLRHRTHGDLLWSGDPAHWNAVAPILFPFVGRSAGDVVRIGGQTYDMPVHGFAAARVFAVEAAEADRCLMSLADDAETRRHYPFAFRLEIATRLDATGIELRATVTNTGDASLPFGFGFHPGLAWPLPGARSKNGHRLDFGPVRRLSVRRAEGGLILPEAETAELENGRLELDDELFRRGAMVLAPSPASALRYGGEDAPVSIVLQWENLPALGLWSRPGAGFICIEPWRGHADPAGFEGKVEDKPGIMRLAPEDSARFALRISVETAAVSAG